MKEWGDVVRMVEGGGGRRWAREAVKGGHGQGRWSKRPFDLLIGSGPFFCGILCMTGDVQTDRRVKLAMGKDLVHMVGVQCCASSKKRQAVASASLPLAA